MNKLPMNKQATVISAVVEGCSIRSVERMMGIHRDTIMKLSIRVGEGCTALMKETMRDLNCTRLECDEIWAYVGKKQRQVTAADDRSKIGDAWTFARTFRVGKRTTEDATAFMIDLAGRLDVRCQLSIDGLNAYVSAC